MRIPDIASIDVKLRADLERALDFAVKVKGSNLTRSELVLFLAGMEYGLEYEPSCNQKDDDNDRDCTN